MTEPIQAGAVSVANGQSGEQAAEAKPAPRWTQQLCPYLSQATLASRPAASGLIAAGVQPMTQQGHAMGCQGHQCMKFMPLQEQDPKTGKMLMTGEGVCADTAMPMAMNVLTNTLAAFMGQYKIKPRI